jgi:heavy metal translocating P-type ATPase
MVIGSRRGAEPHAAQPRVLELVVGGMTCAACAARIERKLDRMEGVSASVSYASERATVAAAPGVTTEAIVEQIVNAGYTAQLVRPQSGDLAEEPTGTEAENRARIRDLRRRLIVATVLAIPLCNLSLGWALVDSIRIPYWQLVLVAMALPVVTWAAWPFHRTALRNARHGGMSMDTLVSIGIIASTVWSLIVMFGPQPIRQHTARSGWALLLDPSGVLYLDVASGVVAFLLIGRLFEARAKRTATGSLRALAGLGAKEASVLVDDGTETRMPVTALRVGTQFVVRPGETVATDGEVERGQSALDCSRMTGEALPVAVSSGDGVLGGTLVVDGRLVVRATRVGEDTQLARMVRLVEQTQADKAAVQRLADRVSGVFVPVVLLLAAVTFASWLAVGGGSMRAVGSGIAVLIIACPCALGLATPTALMVASGVAADHGLFLTGHRALETARTIDTVVLDKTGTVTTGRMQVVDVAVAPGGDRSRLLACAGAVESGSRHGIGLAITRFASAELGRLPEVRDFAASAGYGVSGRVDVDSDSDGVASREVDVVVGRRELMSRFTVPVPDWAQEHIVQWEGKGCSVALVAIGGAVAGLVSVSDTIKPSAHPALTSLRELGLRVVLLTGDNRPTAEAVASELGIPFDDVIAGVLPTEKVDVVRRLHESGHVVAMVGDGVNDAPALAAADLSLAVGSGTDVARDAADLVLVRDDLNGVPFAVSLARGTVNTIRGNLVWAFGYNVAAIPLAAAGWLNPLIAGAAMTLSSMFVLSNSLRLQHRYGIPHDPATDVDRRLGD